MSRIKIIKLSRVMILKSFMVFLAYLLWVSCTFAAVPKKLTDLGAVVPDVNREWTLMVYLDGDNDLERFALLDLNEMEVGMPEKGVTVVALVDRAAGYDDSFGDWQGARVYRLVPDKNPQQLASEKIADIGEINMGDPAVLSEFISATAKKYPARHYGVILWDHGGGWSLMAIDHNAPGSEKEIDSLNLPEVRYGIQQALTKMGQKKLDLIGFDMCLMAQVETAYELSEVARLMVASQAVEPGDGWPYDLFLPMFGRGTAGGGRRLATNIVNAYEDYYSKRKERVATLSAINLDEISSVVKAVDTIVGHLEKDMDRHWSDISRSLFYAETYGDRTDIRRDAKVLASIDLLDAFSRLRQQIPSFPAEDAYLQLVDSMDRTILANYSSPRHRLSNGLAMYAPVTEQQFNSSYKQLRLAQESRWASFLQKLYTSQKQYLSKPEIVDLRVVDSQSGKRVEGGIPGGGFKVEATIKGANVLWVKSVHGKRVSDNGGGVILFEKGYVIDPNFYKKKKEATADIVDLLMPEFKGLENDVSQEYVGRHLWITDGKQASRATVDASNLDDPGHLSVPVLIQRKGLGQHFARVYFDAITWQAVDIHWQIEQPDGSVAYRSIPPKPDDEVILLFEFIPDTPSDISYLRSETLYWRDGLELLIGNDPPEEILVGMQAESIGGQSDFAVAKIKIMAYDNQQQTFMDNAKKVSADNLIGRWRWHGMTGDTKQGWQPLPTYIDISRSTKNQNVLVAGIYNPKDPDWKMIPQMVMLDTRLVPTLRLISFAEDGKPEEAMNFTFLVSKWDKGSPRLILKYLTPKGWLILWAKEGQTGAPPTSAPAQQAAPAPATENQASPSGNSQTPQPSQQQTQPPSSPRDTLEGSWLGQEEDTLIFSGNHYQVKDYGDIIDTGTFQVKQGQIIFKSNVTGMDMVYGMQLKGNTLFLHERSSGLVYQYQRQTGG